MRHAAHARLSLLAATALVCLGQDPQHPGLTAPLIPPAAAAASGELRGAVQGSNSSNTSSAPSPSPSTSTASTPAPPTLPPLGGFDDGGVNGSNSSDTTNGTLPPHAAPLAANGSGGNATDEPRLAGRRELAGVPAAAAAAIVVLAVAAPGFSAAAAMKAGLVGAGCGGALPTALHPTGLTIAGSELVGALVANTAIAAFAALLYAIVTHFIPRSPLSGVALQRSATATPRRQQPNPTPDTHPTARPPITQAEALHCSGLLHPSWGALLSFQWEFQCCAFAGMVFLLHPTEAWHPVAGLGVLIVFLVIPAALAWVVHADARHLSVFGVPERRSGAARALLGSGELLNAYAGKGWVQKYAHLVLPYTAQCETYFVVEYASMFALAALHATFPPGDMGCGHVKAASATLLVASTLSLHTLRPYAKRLSLVMDTVVHLALAGAAGLLAAALYDVAADGDGSVDGGSRSSGGDADPPLLGVAQSAMWCAVGLVAVKAVLESAGTAYGVVSRRRAVLQQSVWLEMDAQLLRSMLPKSGGMRAAGYAAPASTTLNATATTWHSTPDTQNHEPVIAVEHCRSNASDLDLPTTSDFAGTWDLDGPTTPLLSPMGQDSNAGESAFALTSTFLARRGRGGGMSGADQQMSDALLSPTQYTRSRPQDSLSLSQTIDFKSTVRSSTSRRSRGMSGGSALMV